VNLADSARQRLYGNIEHSSITNLCGVLVKVFGVGGVGNVLVGLVEFVVLKLGNESIDTVVHDSGGCVPEEGPEDPDVVEHHEDAESGGITGLRKVSDDGVVEDQVSAHGNTGNDESSLSSNGKEVSAKHNSQQEYNGEHQQHVSLECTSMSLDFGVVVLDVGHVSVGFLDDSGFEF